MPRVRRSSLIAVLLIYVLPLTVATVFLVQVGLGVLALALVAVEAVVLLTVLAVREPSPARREPTPRPWLVPVAMVGALGAMVLVAMLASRGG